MPLLHNFKVGDKLKLSSSQVKGDRCGDYTVRPLPAGKFECDYAYDSGLWTYEIIAINKE